MSMNRKTNIELSKDGKSSMYILTKIDIEGFHHSIFVSKEELVKISKLINNVTNLSTMLEFETCLFSKDNEIVQKITVKGCTASAEMINSILKRFPFDASVIQSSCDGKDKETVIFIKPSHLSDQFIPLDDAFVSLDTIQGIEVVIKKVVTNCQKASELLQELDNFIEALVKDCKPFENETTEPNKPTTKKECYLRQSRK